MSDCSETDLAVTFVQSISDIGETDWNRCSSSGNPFIDYRFLAALENSGSVGEGTGWMPYHLIVTKGSLDTQNQKNTAPLLCVPLYLKSHSYGEYVFDHGWADAYERAGGQYYPKLQGSIPFTPATAPKLLFNRDLSEDDISSVKRAAASGLRTITEQLGLSSLHLTFLTEDDAGFLESQDYLIRHDQQFHWQNNNYVDFDAFLATLSSRKRKQIRKERRTANVDALTIEMHTGDSIRREHWHAFYEFYVDTGSRKWGQPYLTDSFFTEVGASMAEKILLVMVKRDGRYIAGALNFIGEDTLFGRQWGCIEDHPCLHFEVCYYRAIEFAIQHGLNTVEAGAQGQHKLARGYAPVTTRSAHFLPNPSFDAAVCNFLDVERRQVAADQEYLAEHLPFKKEA